MVYLSRREGEDIDHLSRRENMDMENYENYQHVSENNIWKFLTYFQIQGDPLMLTSRTNATFEEVIMFIEEYNSYQVSMTNAHNFDFAMDQTKFLPFFPMHLSHNMNS